MTNYIIRRLLLTVPTMLGFSVILFVLVRLIPGDTALVKSAGDVEALGNPQILQQLRHEMGLDKPVPIQYLEWLGSMLRGDFGTSVWTNESTLKELVSKLPVTIELALGSIFLSTVLGVGIGIVSAVYQESYIDYLGRFFGILGLSVPSFWLGTLLIVIPGLLWGYFPPLGYVSPFVDPWNNFRQFWSPCIALGWVLSAGVMRMTRSQMLEVLGQDYVRTARAKGLSSRVVILRHALKNALIPVVTITGAQIGFLLGGTVVVESVYGLPGLGTHTLLAIERRDYAVIQTNVLFLSTWFVLINLLVDLSYGWLDPRVRYS